jgi:hypothetical protein
MLEHHEMEDVESGTLARIRNCSMTPSRIGWGVLLLCFLALTNCGGCEKAESRIPRGATQEPTRLSTGVTLKPDANGLDASWAGKWPENMEFGPANPRLRQFAGEMDVKNRYASTVMLSLGNPRELPDCGGILLGPRLVLTAASCICALKVDTREEGGREIRSDGSSCAKRVFVTTVVYGEVGDPKLKELTTPMQFHTAEGSVRPHPELELFLNRQGLVVERRADLAVVLLGEPMKVNSAEVLLSRDEAREGESLVMAGYGHDAAVGGFYGARYFRKNRVVSVRPSDGGRILYEQQGASSYNGYDGGPCFREEGERRWLVGVASARADQELTCTSTTVYRDWILAEMNHMDGQQGGAPSEP